ncbi:phosphoribosylamine--glycine ligase [soil metagenome]|jgi:phosphoribosylamine--glycine ligase|nr:phosphoribosylamine--glycine ligase [Acidobacteriota bacterium]
MKVLVVGSGGREHALCWAFKQSGKTEKICCANGNAGIAEIAECVDIKPDEIAKLADFAETSQIDLTFVGGETSLALGIVDEFERRGLKIIGANRQAAQLESSKSFAKDFMAKYNIPTAKYKTAKSVEEAKGILQSGLFGDENASVVVKADGLAAGKGVVVAQNRAEAVEVISGLENLVGKKATEKIVLEEYLTGKEVSLLIFADGKNFALMPPARDHKRIGENDTGANTGGMGVITDPNLLSDTQQNEIIKKIIKPTLNGAEQEGFPFCGILFLGLMMTETGAKVLEYNVRFGDPETQAILVRLETDLIEICQAILNQRLNKIIIKWKKGSSACVVLASRGYPYKAEIGDPINGLNDIAAHEQVVVFHAGTARNETDEFITAGGRVLGVTAAAPNLNDAINRAYNAVRQISFNGMQFRRDIGN